MRKITTKAGIELFERNTPAGSVWFTNSGKAVYGITEEHPAILKIEEI